MGKRDTVRMYGRNFKILLFLKRHPHSEIQVVADFIKLPYYRANQLLNRFHEDGYVEKHKKEKLLLGGELWEFSLSKKGESFLLEMHEEFLRGFRNELD